MIAIVWEFIVKDEAISAFKRAYGQDGEWVAFFRKHPGYHGTSLLQDNVIKGRFLTIDRWVSEALYEQMLQSGRQEYTKLDQTFAALTVSERTLGAWTEDESGRIMMRNGMSPFTGSWAANLEKSRRHANHQFASATMTFDVTDESVSMAYSGVNAAGKEESSALEFYPDGKEHAVSPQAPGVMMVCNWAGTHRLDTEARKGGATLGRGSYEISPDGRVLTATMSGVDASGAAFEQVIVFDRQ